MNSDWDLPNLPFPRGEEWEITPENARRWLLGRFRSRVRMKACATIGVDLGGDELLLLVYDLDFWEAGLLRGDPVKPLHEFLLPGREAWGDIARELRIMQAEREARSRGRK